MTSNGNRFDTEYAQHCRVENGLIRWWRVFEDSWALSAALFDDQPAGARSVGAVEGTT